eukprot:tig00020965_g16820.t1
MNQSRNYEGPPLPRGPLSPRDAANDSRSKLRPHSADVQNHGRAKSPAATAAPANGGGYVPVPPSAPATGPDPRQPSRLYSAILSAADYAGSSANMTFVKSRRTAAARRGGTVSELAREMEIMLERLEDMMDRIEDASSMRTRYELQLQKAFQLNDRLQDELLIVRTDSRGGGAKQEELQAAERRAWELQALLTQAQEAVAKEAARRGALEGENRQLRADVDAARAEASRAIARATENELGAADAQRMKEELSSLRSEMAKHAATVITTSRPSSAQSVHRAPGEDAGEARRLRTELDTARARLAESAASEGELRRLREQAASLQAKLEGEIRGRAEAEARAAAAEKSLAKAEAECGRLREAAAGAPASGVVGEESAQLRERAAAAEAARGVLDVELREEKARTDRLQAELDAARQSEAAKSEELKATLGELQIARIRSAEEKTEMAGLRETIGQLQADYAALGARIKAGAEFEKTVAEEKAAFAAQLAGALQQQAAAIIAALKQ